MMLFLEMMRGFNVSETKRYEVKYSVYHKFFIKTLPFFIPPLSFQHTHPSLHTFYH